jgi:hypothetical protein
MGAVAVAVVVAISPPAQAQWVNVPPAAIPRTPDGKPNLSAPAPRSSEGKPDLSGIWQAADFKYVTDIAADLKPEDVPFQPWAKAVYEERRSGGRFKESASELPAARRPENCVHASRVANHPDARLSGDSL